MRWSDSDIHHVDCWACRRGRLLERLSWREGGKGKSESEGWRGRVVEKRVVGEEEVVRGKVSWIVFGGNPQEVAGGIELGDGIGKDAEELCTDWLVGT